MNYFFPIIVLAFIIHAKSAAISLIEIAPITNVPVPWDIAFAAGSNRVFVAAPDSEIFIYDTKTLNCIERHRSVSIFSNLDLTPDGRYLFATDDAGTQMGSGNPWKPHYVHRYDIAEGKWMILKAPKIAYRIEAVSKNRILLLEWDQHVDVTLNDFDDTTNAMYELFRTDAGYYGDFEFDPVTGRIYHGNSRSSSNEITVLKLDGNYIVFKERATVYGAAMYGGGSSVLSPCGKYFFYGILKIDALCVSKNLDTFPEIIYAVNNDIACGKAGYYDIRDGKKLGSFTFSTTTGYYGTRMAFSNDGEFFCIYDEGRKALRLFRQDQPTAADKNFQAAFRYDSPSAGLDLKVMFDLRGRNVGIFSKNHSDGDVRKRVYGAAHNATGLYLIKSPPPY